VLVTVLGERARVVHFTFHILRRTAGGRRLGNVAEGPHSFRIKQRRRRSRRRRSSSSSSCKSSLPPSIGCERAPQRPQNTLCPGRNISPPSPPPQQCHHRSPSHTNHHQSPAHPRAVHGVVTENRLQWIGGWDKKNIKYQATRLHCARTHYAPHADSDEFEFVE